MNCDLLIIGGGPAGLSAAVSASSEGLNVIVVDSAGKFGGQAGSSSLIENFLGFPDGISGDELTQKSLEQATKFKTEFLSPFNAIKLETTPEGLHKVVSDMNDSIICKTILLATGVNYRSHTAQGLSRFIGYGVSYGSPSLSESFKNVQTIVIIGGANSAGQAAVHLASCSECEIKLVVRANSVTDRMSDYLIKKIESFSNIEVLLNTEVVQAKGIGHLQSVVVRDPSGEREIPTTRMYILIGAKPKTLWLQGTVVLDKNGFIVTGADVFAEPTGEGLWPRTDKFRPPLSMETIPGVFAAGDVRAQPLKRVAGAVGEGAKAVTDIHSYLAKYIEVEKVQIPS